MAAFTGQKVLVCGAGRGIGRACALAFAQQGATVFAAARTLEDLEAVAAEALANGSGVVHPVVSDVTTPEGQQRLFDACPEPQVLVTNSGGPRPGGFRDFEREDWQQALDQSLISTLLLIREAVARMTPQRYGRIVNITSSAVKAPLPFLALSNAARSALTSAVSGLAREVAAEGITLNNVLPGPTDTERLRSNFEHRAARAGVPAETLIAETLRKIPAQRFGTPAEVAHAVILLAHEQAGFITGQNLLVDGGAFPGVL